jgi:hypothetical protein
MVKDPEDRAGTTFLPRSERQVIGVEVEHGEEWGRGGAGALPPARPLGKQF